MIGTKLSHFEITAELGEGGMGTVYRADDTRLGREVAIKVLPEAFTADVERLARFEREARLLASLSHPNIAAIHQAGSERISEPREEASERTVHYLVMELVPGETLAERIRRRPIPVGETISIALQIAGALEAAYDHQIIHRDLKPANIKFGSEGTVKILDFGLAKVADVLVGRPEERSDEGPGDMSSPTLTYPATEPGTILGTAPYMSPEQARGGRVDGRADLWALGTIVFEMLTGRRLFTGETVADTVAAVMNRPIDVDALPEASPPSLRRLLRRLLERDLDSRLRHPGDACLELRDARKELAHGSSEDGGGPTEPTRARVRPFRLTMDVCRHLDRERLVPGMIGDATEYLDNGRASEVLAVYLPSLASDSEQFREVIEHSSYRGLAFCPYGWQDSAELRPEISLRDHLTMICCFLEDAISRVRPRTTVLVGFSSGSDMALRLPSEAGVETPPIDAILALGPNLSLGTCFYTGRLASIRSDSSDEMFRTLKETSASMDSLEAWALITPYLLKLARRFRSDVGTVRELAKEIVAPFEEDGPSPFATWYRSVRARDIAVRAVFCNEPFDREGLAALRMAHLDSGVLGSDFDEGDLVAERDRNHFELLDPELVDERIEELVAATRDAGGGRGRA